MRVLVTGAGGSLGRVVVPALARAGRHPVLLDFRRFPTEREFIETDVRDAGAMARAMDGVDAVVHAGALHGIHLQGWSPDDFWSINVTGTYNVYQAAREAGVRHVVLGSSMVVYGDVGSGDDPLERYGFRLLFGGVDDRDVAQSVLRALEHRPAGGFGAYDIMADGGLTAADLPRLQTDAEAVLDDHWPGTSALMRERDLDLADLLWGRRIYPVDHAKDVLGYRPQFDFASFLDAVRLGDQSYYSYAHEPWWGAQRPTST